MEREYTFRDILIAQVPAIILAFLLSKPLGIFGLIVWVILLIDNYEN